MVVGVIALLEGETLCARVLHPYSGTLCTPPVDSLSDDPPGALESLVASPECYLLQTGSEGENSTYEDTTL